MTRLVPRREHRPRAFACAACSQAFRLIFTDDGLILCLCHSCAATYALASVEGHDPREVRP